jgi:hypothetical protein
MNSEEEVACRNPARTVEESPDSELREKLGSAHPIVDVDSDAPRNPGRLIGSEKRIGDEAPVKPDTRGRVPETGDETGTEKSGVAGIESGHDPETDIRCEVHAVELDLEAGINFGTQMNPGAPGKITDPEPGLDPRLEKELKRLGEHPLYAPHFGEGARGR